MMRDSFSDLDRCDCCSIHEEVISHVRERLPEDNILSDLAGIFKIFGDLTRVKILCALLHSEMCVCDIASLLGMTKSAISHQLRALRQTKLVKCRKEGKIVYYSIADSHVQTIVDQGLVHVCE